MSTALYIATAGRFRKCPDRTCSPSRGLRRRGVLSCHSAAEVARLLICAGFRDLAYAQTLFRDLDDVTTAEPVLDGHGRGGFVVIRGNKPAPTASPGAEVPGAGS